MIDERARNIESVNKYKQLAKDKQHLINNKDDII
jgi:hypothetical protein